MYPIERYTINIVMRNNVQCWELWDRKHLMDVATFYDQFTCILCVNFLNERSIK